MPMAFHFILQQQLELSLTREVMSCSVLIAFNAACTLRPLPRGL